MSKKQTAWSRSYVERAYDRIAVTVPRGRKADIEAFLVEDPEHHSLNGLINDLLREKLGIPVEEWKKAPGE